MAGSAGLRRMSRRGLSLLVSVGLVAGLLAAAAGPAAAVSLPRVAVYDSAATAGYASDVLTKLRASGQFSAVDDLSQLLGAGHCPAGNPTPTLATLQQYAAVLVYSDCPFPDAVALGNVLADYVDGGGHVVVATFDFNSSFDNLAGRLVTGGYLPLTQGSQTEGTRMFLVADLPSDPLLAGVASFDGGSSSYHALVSLAAGATQVAHWTDGSPLVAAKGNVVALNFYPPSSDARADFWNSATAGVRLLTNALGTTPDVTISVHHVGNFGLNRLGTYTIVVSNVGGGRTTGLVTVTDVLPTGLLGASISGYGWACIQAFLALTCSRSDHLAPRMSYPPISVGVSPYSALITVVNTARVAGGGEVNTSNDSASDPTFIALH